MRVVGLISSYKEGPLIQHAIRTAMEACDSVYVLEGPAGAPLEAEVPETELGDYSGRVQIDAGRWRSDARKRTVLLQWAQREYGGPLWGLWLDADEVLVNGEYLRDWLQLLTWQEQSGGGRAERCPLRLVELDGSISVTFAKLVRIDLVRSYEVSIAELLDEHGQIAKAGNFHDSFARYLDLDPGRAAKLGQGYLYWPPGPAPLDPYIVHRSSLRHPARAGLRMNEQEASELAHRDRT